MRCNAQLPSLGLVNLERIRFAALRVRKGSLLLLSEALTLAEVDWRDLLVAAGFAEDPTAHLRWSPTASAT